MMYAIFCCILLLWSFTTINCNLTNLSVQDPNRYGPYNLNCTRFELCSGPRSKNLTRLGAALRSEGLTFIGHFNFTFLETTHLDEIKIVVYSVKHEKITHLLYTYKVNNPCKHYAFAAVINTAFKSSNCIVHKGDYSLVLNFEKLQVLFFGKSFFYGEYLLKTTLISRNGNIFCLNLGTWFIKKSGA